MMPEPFPDKLYAIRGGPEPGYLAASLLVFADSLERNGFEVAEYVPKSQLTRTRQELRDLAAGHTETVFALVKAWDERNTLRACIEAEVERLRKESGDPQLNEFAQQQAQLDADRLQTLLDGGEG